jgi:hypothetical protein
MPPLDRGREALIKKVLGDPDFYPPEFKAWVPRQIENNPTLRLSADQLPIVEAVHLVGGTGEPAFQNSWVNYAVGSFLAAGFYKDPWGRVHLQGLVANGAAPISTIFTLPGGYRPQYGTLFVAYANGLGRVDVGANGAVQLVNGSTAFVQLDGLSFRAYG